MNLSFKIFFKKNSEANTLYLSAEYKETHVRALRDRPRYKSSVSTES